MFFRFWDCCRGVEQDLAEAYRLYSEGMKLHDAHSMAYAGNLRVRGAGTSPNYLAAKTMFERTKVRKKAFRLSWSQARHVRFRRHVLLVVFL